MAMPAALNWLVAALSLAMLPHLMRLPWWLGILFAGAVSWCWLSATGSFLLPRRWLLVALTLISITAILLHYNTLFGRDAGVALLGNMAALKFLELRTRRDAMALVLLGYFLSMANLLYTQSLPTAVYLLVVIAILLAAQINLQRHYVALPPAALLRLVAHLIVRAIPVMLILFVLFPRIPGPLWGLPKDAYRGLSGLSDEMRPGSISQLSLSDEVVFRVRFRGPIPPAEQLYWRGPVLGKYDGYSWRRFADPGYTEFSYRVEGQPVDYTVILEPHGKRWLFALDLPAKLPLDTGITKSLQLIRKQPVNEVLRYEMRSYLRYHTGTVKVSRQQNLPPHINPQARALAAEWQKRHADPEAILHAALALFRRQPFHYTLRPPLLRHKNAIDQFLFETRRGFCEHYASSFVFLMRAAGIPARVITGYQGGERNPLGDYFIVRQSEAHAWAEVWLKQRGWVRVDPTAAVAPERVEHGLYAALENTDVLPLLARRDYPWIRQLALGWDSLNNAWNEWVLAYGPERQGEFLTALGFFAWLGSSALALAMVITLTSVVLLYGVFHTLRQRITTDPVAYAYRRFCSKLARRGLVREPHEGPLDFTKRAANCRPDVAVQIQLIGQLYANLRYGRSMGNEAIRRLQRLISHLKI